MRIAELPNDKTIFEYLKEQSGFEEAVNDIKQMSVGLVELSLGEDLKDAVQEVINLYGMGGFICSDKVDMDPEYVSMSLTYNPDMGGDPHRSTLGSPLLTQAEHYYATPETLKKIGSRKNSYYDTYGFRSITPALEHIGLTKRLKRSLVRSRMSTIKAGRPATAGFMFGWHKDETVFENLRVNIPVYTSDEYALQIENSGKFPTPESQTITSHVMQEGKMYSWDTNLPHRAYAKQVGTKDRTHIVLGFSPWFDYDPVVDEWRPNEFFGKKHPMQMLLDGDVL